MERRPDMSLQPFHKPQEQQVLGELLHSLSQPLTSLRCSLELSIDKASGENLNTVAVALEQAERIVGLIRLMREYLDTETAVSASVPVAICPILCEVLDQMRSVASVRRIAVSLVGVSETKITMSRTHLRLALQYLISSLIDGQSGGREIAFHCGEDSSGFLLRAETTTDSNQSSTSRDPVTATSQHVRLVIASRLLESAGASLSFENDSSGFLLRVPAQVPGSSPSPLLS
jgi:hypothetical protein